MMVILHPCAAVCSGDAAVDGHRKGSGRGVGREGAATNRKNNKLM